MPDLRVVILHFPGPLWQAGKPPFEQPGLQAHVDHYRKLAGDGQLALGGPYVDGADGLCGMMISVPGADAAALAAYAEADPAVQSGLLRAELRTWLVGMKA